MSEDKSVSNAPSEVSDSNEETKQVVPKDAYEKVSQDMHKYKSKMKEYEASLAQLQADLKMREEAELQEKQQYKELFEKRNAELEDARKQAAQVKEQYLNTSKRSALKQELGGRIRDEYLSFADLGQIKVDESGIIDMESVRMVANDFRKQHGQLIPATDNANITGQAASSNADAPQVDLSKLSSKELVEHFAKLTEKKH